MLLDSKVQSHSKKAGAVMSEDRVGQFVYFPFEFWTIDDHSNYLFVLLEEIRTNVNRIRAYLTILLLCRCEVKFFLLSYRKKSTYSPCLSSYMELCSHSYF